VAGESKVGQFGNCPTFLLCAAGRYLTVVELLTAEDEYIFPLRRLSFVLFALFYIIMRGVWRFLHRNEGESVTRRQLARDAKLRGANRFRRRRTALAMACEPGGQ
jgi:Ser/Thr protein kinase RdoA (MazF antagonist)